VNIGKLNDMNHIATKAYFQVIMHLGLAHGGDLLHSAVFCIGNGQKQ
jgi:hypothetical protein